MLTLALGIGTNAAVFSVIDALIMKTLPVPDPEQLVLFKRVEASNRTASDLPYPMFERCGRRRGQP